MSPFTAVTSSKAVGTYIQRLDLGADPFTADFDSEYFYEGAMRRDSLDQLVHFSRFSDQIVVLTGNTGSGTSRLLDRMFDQLDQIIDYCDINGEEDSTPELIIEALVEQLQLQLTPPYRIDEFIAVFRENPYIGIDSAPLLVAIDQAHFLSIESYNLLLTILENTQRRIRLLLVGEYQIEQLSTLAGFSPEKLKVLELSALTSVETGEFVLGLLRAAGYAGDQPLSKDQIEVLWEKSGGNIAEIIRLAPALLETEKSAQTKKFQLRIPPAHSAAIVILALGLGLSYWYLGKDGSIEQAGAAQNSNGPSMVIRKEFTNDSEADLPAFSSSLPGSDSLDKAGQRNVELGVSSTTTSIVDPEEYTEIVLAKDMVESKSLDQMKIASDNSTVELAASNEEAKITPVSAAQDGEFKEKISVNDLAKAVVPIQSGPPVSTPEKTSENETSDRVVEAFSANDQRLLGLPASAYMLQLTGSVDEKRIKEFVKRNSGRVSIGYFETRLNNKPWFVAVTGSFKSRSLAVEAIKGLPSGLKKQNPWARSVSSIQNDIRSR
jgi:DamX protein